ncbi:MAG: hypothetical protein DHS20C05_14160 [Hyphococcus sp.]|nr:MAG: hypothetical protein DHS20C05_14160 [Marinicaulis sp.]
MMIRKIALSSVFLFYAAPALGQSIEPVRKSQPRPIMALTLGSQSIEMLAVTQRARADTPLRRAYVKECKSLSKVMPGYPQPAFVSIDFRLKF